MFCVVQCLVMIYSTQCVYSTGGNMFSQPVHTVSNVVLCSDAVEGGCGHKTTGSQVVWTCGWSMVVCSSLATWWLCRPVG